MIQIQSVLGDGAVSIGRRGAREKGASVSSAASRSGAKVSRSKPKVVSGLGCANCPANDRVGVSKVKTLDSIKGKEIMIWGIAPNATDNTTRREFSGAPGEFLWKELSRLGVSRKDCDVQYVCRCWPTERDPKTHRMQDRPPSKAELKCCSVYTLQALERNGGKATVHLVFGQVAAQALLGREYRKDRPNFWSERLQAKVCVLAHPSYFLRGGAPGRLHEWRVMLANAIGSVENSGQFAYLEQQDYKLVQRGKSARRVVKSVLAAAKAKERLSVDIEYGWVDPRTGVPCDPAVGVKSILVVGLCWKSGVSRVFVVDHPEKASYHNRSAVVSALKRVLEDPKVKKVMHHGTADAKPLAELLDIHVKGYDFDTNYSTYLKWPQQKKYGLEEMAQTRVPEFAGYKDIIKPYMTAPINYANIPLKVMRLYNGADCDITKRLEAITVDKSGPLLRTYRDVAFVLDDMQTRGPYFDSKYYNEVVSLVPKRLEKVKQELTLIAGNPDINLNSPPQVKAVLYDKLKFKTPEGYPPFTTQAEVMRIFSQHPKKGAFPKGLIEYRELSKMEGTYLSNYRESAAINGGQLRTLWWLTGTITGRLRSGGKDKGQTGIVNFQNLHGEPMLQNLLISDPKWRRVLRAWGSDKGASFDSLYAAHKAAIRKLVAFLAFDYGQIEIRMAAEMSGDPMLIAAVESGDIHTAVGHELTGWDKDRIKNDKETRTLVKNLHFGILYGMSQNSLHSFLVGLGIKIERSRSDELHTKYFRTYRKVRELIEHLQAFAERHGYVETLFGFRRPLNTAGNDEDGRSTFWGNQAINSPIQGSAHQLMLFAMATLHNEPDRFPLLQVPVMEVHDALDFYVALGDLRPALAQGIELLQHAVPAYIEKNYKRKLKVPLVAEGAAGLRLGVMLPYDGGTCKQFVKGWLAKNDAVEEKINSTWRKAA